MIEADNGTEALEAAARHPGTIHLLLTDVVMPVMGRRELAECLKASRLEMRVLFMSGYSEDSIDHRGALEGGLAYLPKPFTLDELAARVRSTLEAPAATSPSSSPAIHHHRRPTPTQGHAAGLPAEARSRLPE